MATIRPIEPADVTAAVSLIVADSVSPEAERPTEVETYWAAVEETRARGGDVLVAELDGDVVGVTQVMVFPHFQHAGGWCCELESVHVRGDLRSRGIGAELLAGAEELARAKGCYRIQLSSRTFRVDAHRFYLANGFELTSQGFKKSLEG